MKLRSSLWAIGLCVIASTRAGAEDFLVLPLSANPPQSPNWLVKQAQGQQEQPPQPAQPPAQPQQPLVPDAFAEAPTAGGEAPRGLNPNMIGDFPGTFNLQTITVPSVKITQQVLNIPVFTDSGVKGIIQKPLGPPVTTTITVQTVTRVLSASSALGFKVAENQSPQPSDRAFFTYNYFGNIQGPSGPFANPQTTTVVTTQPAQAMGINGQPAGTTLTTTVNTVVPGAPPPRQYLNGGVIGFEKSFFDGLFSVGVRAPLYSQQGDGSFNQQDFGDLGLLVNYAFYLDRTTGNTLSGGLMVTLPTGPAVDTSIGNIHSTEIQPFLGYRWNWSDFYVIGFTSLAVPTDGRDVLYFFNDVGVGYWIYRAAPDRLISGIAPTVEAHVSTPLNHRQFTDPVYGFNEVDMTAGVNFGLRRNSILTFGVSTPVTGPRPFGIEAITQFNFRF